MTAEVSRWTRDRRTFLGGSEIAAVVGLHPTRNALDVWGAKVANYEPMVGPEAEVGHAYEAPTAELYRTRNNVAEPLMMFGTVVDPDAPWAGATPDRLRMNGAKACTNVQIKIVGEHMTRRWGRPDESPESVPVEVLAQVAWESRAIEKGLGIHVEGIHVVANLGGTNIVTYPIEYDREFSALLFERARTWWETHVVGRVMPEITDENADSARAVLAALHPRDVLPMLPPGDPLLELAWAYERAAKLLKGSQANRDACHARLCQAIGDSIGFQSDDERVRVTWKTNRSGVRSLRVDIKEGL